MGLLQETGRVLGSWALQENGALLSLRVELVAVGACGCGNLAARGVLRHSFT